MSNPILQSADQLTTSSLELKTKKTKYVEAEAKYLEVKQRLVLAKELSENSMGTKTVQIMSDPILQSADQLIISKLESEIKTEKTKYLKVKAKYLEAEAKYLEVKAKYLEAEAKYLEVKAKYLEAESKYLEVKAKYFEVKRRLVLAKELSENSMGTKTVQIMSDPILQSADQLIISELEFEIKTERAKYFEAEAKYLEVKAKYPEAEAKYLEEKTKYGEAEAKYLEEKTKYGEAEAKYLEVKQRLVLAKELSENSMGTKTVQIMSDPILQSADQLIISKLESEIKIKETEYLKAKSELQEAVTIESKSNYHSFNPILEKSLLKNVVQPALKASGKSFAYTGGGLIALAGIEMGITAGFGFLSTAATALAGAATTVTVGLGISSVGTLLAGLGTFGAAAVATGGLILVAAAVVAVATLIGYGGYKLHQHLNNSEKTEVSTTPFQARVGAESSKGLEHNFSPVHT